MRPRSKLLRAHGIPRCVPKEAERYGVPLSLALAVADLRDLKTADQVRAGLYEIESDTTVRARQMTWFMRLRTIDNSYTEET